jgi:DNA-binding GntR family transcriptional regulator
MPANEAVCGMRKIKGESLKIRAYKEIKNMILVRDLLQGEKIFEKDLAETMQMSRTPVREALLLLEQENLVENQNRLGFVVRRLQSDEIIDYYNTREVLEIYAAPLMAANITEEEIEALESNLSRASAYFASGDTRNLVSCDTEFHELLYKSSHSKIFYRTLGSLNDISILLRSIAQRNPSGMKEALEGHKAIVETLKTRDADRLKKVLVDHLKGAAKRNEAFLELIG